MIVPVSAAEARKITRKHLKQLMEMQHKLVYDRISGTAAAGFTQTQFEAAEIRFILDAIKRELRGLEYTVDEVMQFTSTPAQNNTNTMTGRKLVVSWGD